MARPSTFNVDPVVAPQVHQPGLAENELGVDERREVVAAVTCKPGPASACCYLSGY